MMLTAASNPSIGHTTGPSVNANLVKAGNPSSKPVKSPALAAAIRPSHQNTVKEAPAIAHVVGVVITGGVEAISKNRCFHSLSRCG